MPRVEAELLWYVAWEDDGTGFGPKGQLREGFTQKGTQRNSSSGAGDRQIVGTVAIRGPCSDPATGASAAHQVAMRVLRPVASESSEYVASKARRSMR